MFSTKLTSLSLLVEKEWKHNAGFTSWLTQLYLLFYSKKYLWVAKTLFYPNLRWKIKQLIVLRFKRIHESHWMTICPFFMHFARKSKAGKKNLTRMDEFGPNQFHGVQMNDIPIAEELLLLYFVLYDIDIVDRNIIGELARRSVQKYKNTLRLLRYNIHFCCLTNNAVYQSFRCPICDTFSNSSTHFWATFNNMHWTS